MIYLVLGAVPLLGSRPALRFHHPSPRVPTIRSVSRLNFNFSPSKRNQLHKALPMNPSCLAGFCHLPGSCSRILCAVYSTLLVSPFPVQDFSSVCNTVFGMCLCHLASRSSRSHTRQTALLDGGAGSGAHGGHRLFYIAAGRRRARPGHALLVTLAHSQSSSSRGGEWPAVSAGSKMQGRLHHGSAVRL